ncbi:MAG: DnaD domain protein [Clostridia bacterium]|nr:DnaD domain protein [Clostridia bacterium]
MPDLILKNDTGEKGVTIIQNTFIDEYMPKANGEFVKVYLYGLRNLYNGKQDISNSQIASDLDMLESDVIRAWKYWNKKGAISLVEKENSITIEYRRLEDTPPLSNNIVLHTRPNYSPKEISIYIKNSEQIRLLFKTAEQKLGKMLTQQDTSILFSLYDWLRLPVEVIIMLLEYCSSMDKRNMRYIEKVAIQWSELGLNTVEKAEQWLKKEEMRNKDIKKIMSSLGLHRFPTKFEMEYMDKWMKKWCFSIDVILAACSATINTSNPSFKYIDAILYHWYQNNIKTKEEAYNFMNEFRKKKTAKKPSKNKFHNFSERDYDFKELEKKIIEKNLKMFGG